MSRTVNALKNLALKVTSATSVADVEGNTISEVLSYIVTNFVTKEKGDKGDTGAYITAIELELTDGVVTGGTATLSDETTVEITVTEANDGE